MKSYPQVDVKKNPDLLLSYIQKERGNDIRDFQNLPEKFMSGRKVGKIPTNSSDIESSDRDGDFNYDSTYFYICDGAQWRTLPFTEFASAATVSDVLTLSQTTEQTPADNKGILWVASGSGTQNSQAYEQGDLLFTGNVGGTEKTILIADWSVA